MRNVVLRPEAKRDIATIAHYTAQKWGRKQARLYLVEMRQVIEGLSVSGPRHPLADARHPGLRRVRSGRHLVFYFVSQDAIDVVRILHERMDADARF